MREWEALYSSKSGERGIFSRYAADDALPDRREKGHEWGTNPCAEIILRSRQFCNLSEIVVRPDDTLETLHKKADLATFAGTLQATLTDFRYLSSPWKKNTEEEALLGVSLTGIMDHPFFGIGAVESGDSVIVRRRLETLKSHVIERNKYYASKLGIHQAAATTCVKPSGTVSQLVSSASGIHPRYAPYYIRRVRSDSKDPLCKALIDQGVPHEEGYLNKNETIFAFPIKSPDTSSCVADVSAVAQLEHWLIYAEAWCEHKPSISVYVREHEWLDVAAWVWAHFGRMTGVSFFPYDDHSYRQAPYTRCSKEEYEVAANALPVSLNLDIAEEGDTTVSSQELACTSGVCEI
jgi:ribonucleoside-diphosphate reductase alpha chain